MIIIALHLKKYISSFEIVNSSLVISIWLTLFGKMMWIVLCFMSVQCGTEKQTNIIAEYFNLSGFHQFNNVINSFGSMLDLGFSTCSDIKPCLVDECLLHCDLFHPAVSFHLPFSNNLYSSFQQLSRRNFRLADYSSINKYLSHVDWINLEHLNAENALACAYEV